MTIYDNLAFEEDAIECSLELWRVTSWRTYSGRELRHTKWFATERAARQHAEWVDDGRGEVISIAKYVRDPEPATASQEGDS